MLRDQLEKVVLLTFKSSLRPADFFSTAPMATGGAFGLAKAILSYKPDGTGSRFIPCTHPSLAPRWQAKARDCAKPFELPRDGFVWDWRGTRRGCIQAD